MTRPQTPTPRLDQLSDEEHQRLRAALVQFFLSRGSAMPDDHASETILRVLEGAARGLEFENLHAYAHGVAKHVLQEYRRGLAPAEMPTPEFVPLFSEQLQRCLEKCKNKCLSRQERRLIERYYLGPEGSVKIASRQALAASLGITVDALRIRAHRIRKKLAACVEACRQGAGSMK